jgi:type IV secretory pathway VirB3-like protein
MFVALLRLFALRPFFTLAIFGIPLFVLIAVGLFTILALKLLVFVVLPIAAVVWLVRRLSCSGDSPAL